MTDERLGELQVALGEALQQRNIIKEVIETDLLKIRNMSAEVTRLNEKRKNDAPKYDKITEIVANLTNEIHAEGQRRMQETRAAAAKAHKPAKKKVDKKK